MKKLCYFFLFSLLIGCSSTRLVSSWKNSDTPDFKTDKILVVGMTQNLNARSLFEEKLRSQLFLRDINAIKSLEVFTPEFTHSRKTEEDIIESVKVLKQKGFDAILVTAVKGAEIKKVRHKEYYDFNYRFNSYRNYYFMHQDIYYQPGYYEEYKVYHVESSLYSITSDAERTLVWTGSIDIINPSKVHNTVIDFVERIIKSLEKEQLIKKL
ncbi:MAG: hypothetical protein QNK20_01490 [Aureibaculum sp.]|nr:hypothetical protein [Aureibaculum sp.]